MKVNIGSLGIWSLELRAGPPDQVADAAADLHEQGWGALWIAGAAGAGIFDDAERLLAAGPHAAVALGVMSRWSPDADHAATRHAALTDRFGDRLLMGIGISNEQAAAATGHRFGPPLREMGAYLDELDGGDPALRKEARVLGALGPQMVALAGRRAAGVHPFLVTPEWTASARSILGEGPIIAPQQAVVLDTNAERAWRIARDRIAMFIGFPAYQANLRRLGFGDDDLRPGGSDRVIDATVAWGDLDDIAERIRRHHVAGADHVALHVLTDHGELPRTEWRALSLLQP